MSAGGEETRNGIITVSINYSMKMEPFKTLVASRRVSSRNVSDGDFDFYCRKLPPTERVLSKTATTTTPPPAMMDGESTVGEEGEERLRISKLLHEEASKSWTLFNTLEHMFPGKPSAAVLSSS